MKELFFMAIVVLIGAKNGLTQNEVKVFQARIDMEEQAWPIVDHAPVLDNVCPNTINITATSHLKSYKGINYKAENLTKLNKNAWSEGVKGNGLGQTLEVRIKEKIANYEPWRLSSQWLLINGYIKDQQTWENNTRVKQFEIYKNDRLLGVLNVKDTPFVQTFNIAELAYGTLKIGDCITFKITAIYEGEKYDDTCLSLLVPTCAS